MNCLTSGHGQNWKIELVQVQYPFSLNSIPLKVLLDCKKYSNKKKIILIKLILICYANQINISNFTASGIQLLTNQAWL